MVIRYLLTLGLTVFTSGLILAFLVNPMISPNMPLEGSKLASRIASERKEVHDQCLAQVKKDLAVSDELWLEFMGEYEDKVAHDTLLGSGAVGEGLSDEPIVKTARKVLVEYGINPEKVIIELVTNDTPAQALQSLDDEGNIIHAIQIDLHRISDYCMPIQEALIRHEVMHLLNYDSLEGSYLISMLYQMGFSAGELEKIPSIIAYRHQRELRADLLAGCDHPEVIAALQEFFAGFMHAADQDDATLWTLHPSDKQRHEQLALLYLNSEKNITV